MDANAILRFLLQDMEEQFRYVREVIRNHDCYITLEVLADVLLRALVIFDKTPKLDFVDCLLYGYKIEKGAGIITFDKKLQKRLEMVGI